MFPVLVVAALAASSVRFDTFNWPSAASVPSLTVDDTEPTEALTLPPPEYSMDFYLTQHPGFNLTRRQRVVSLCDEGAVDGPKLSGSHRLREGIWCRTVAEAAGLRVGDEEVQVNAAASKSNRRLLKQFVRRDCPDADSIFLHLFEHYVSTTPRYAQNYAWLFTAVSHCRPELDAFLFVEGVRRGMKEERLLWMWRFLQAQYLKSGEVGWCYSPGGTDVFRRIMDAEQYQLGAEIAVTLRAAASMDVDNCLGGAEVRMLLRGRYYEALEKGLSEITMAQLRSVMSVVFNKTWNSFKAQHQSQRQHLYWSHRRRSSKPKQPQWPRIELNWKPSPKGHYWALHIVGDGVVGRGVEITPEEYARATARKMMESALNILRPHALPAAVPSAAFRAAAGPLFDHPVWVERQQSTRMALVGSVVQSQPFIEKSPLDTKTWNRWEDFRNFGSYGMAPLAFYPNANVTVPSQLLGVQKIWPYQTSPMLEYASLLADLGAGILHGSPLLHLLESGRVEDSISMFAFMSAMLEHNICGGEVERQLQHGVLAAGISDSTSAHPLLRRALLGPNYLVSSSVSFVSARAFSESIAAAVQSIMSSLTFDWRVSSGEMPLAAVVRGVVEHPYTLGKLDNVFAWPMVSIYHADDVSESLEHLAKSPEFHRKDEILLRLLTSDSYTPDNRTLGVVTAVATLVIAHVAVQYLISHQARWGRLELSDVSRAVHEADLGFRLEPSPKVVFIILRILLLLFCMRRRRMVITVLLLWTALCVFSYANRWSSTKHASDFVEDWKQRFGLDHPELEKTWKESCSVSPDVQGILWLTFFRGLYKSVFYPPKPLQESKSVAFHTYVKVCRTGFAAHCPAIQFARVLKLVCASVVIMVSLAGSMFPQGWTILFHDSHTFHLLRNHPILLSVCMYSFFSLFFDFLIELFEPFAAAWALTVKRQRQVGRLVTAIPVTKRTVDSSVAKHWGLTYHHLNWKPRPHRLYAEGDEGYLFDDLAVEPTDGMHDVTAVSDIEGWVAVAYFFAMIHACEAKRIAWTLHSYFLIGVCGLAGVIVTDWFAFESLNADHVFLSIAVMAFLLHCFLIVGVLEFRRQEDLEVQWLHHWRATLPLGAGMGKFLDGVTATIKSTDIDFYPAVDSFRSWILLASIFGCSITLLLHSWRDAVRIALLRLPTPLKAPW